MKDARDQKIPYKIYLSESEMPKTWYNVRADMKNKPAPLLNPGTLKPMTAEELSGVFCEELVQQELDNDSRYIDIPQEIQDFYKMYRPSPLVRAYCLEEKLQTPAKIYYKFEGNNTSGSHKLNSAIAQAYYAKKQGLKGVTTETGQDSGDDPFHLPALIWLDCKVYMVKCSMNKALPPQVMRAYGASVTPNTASMERRSAERSNRTSRHRWKSGVCDFQTNGDSHAERRIPLCAGKCVKPGAAASVHHRHGDEGGA